MLLLLNLCDIFHYLRKYLRVSLRVDEFVDVLLFRRYKTVSHRNAGPVNHIVLFRRAGSTDLDPMPTGFESKCTYFHWLGYDDCLMR